MFGNSIYPSPVGGASVHGQQCQRVAESTDSRSGRIADTFTRFGLCMPYTVGSSHHEQEPKMTRKEFLLQAYSCHELDAAVTTDSTR